MKSLTYIEPEILKSKMDMRENLMILDVRNPDEFHSWNIDGSINIPLSELPGNIHSLSLEKPIVTVCLHGIRSKKASEILLHNGYHVAVLAGGMIGWNKIFDIVEIAGNATHENETKVLQFRRVGKGCISYMIIKKQIAIVIDPTTNIEVYIHQAKKYNAKIVGVFETHTHADHISGAPMLSEKTNALYFSPDWHMLHPHSVVVDSLPVSFETITITPVATPGHTPEHVTYLFDGCAFTCDTLFIESVGRPDLGHNVKENAEILWHSLQNILLKFPPDTKIFPGHYSEKIKLEKNAPLFSTILDVKKNISALSLEKDAFIQWIEKSQAPKPENFETIKKINTGELKISQSPEFEDLEAGPNRCAVSG